MTIGLGTSGFSYPEWRPSFYPADVPPARFLAYYASRFNAVEIDSTAYRFPTEVTLRNWASQTPADFRFAVKAPPRIMHPDGLRVPSRALQLLTHQLPLLEAKLGVVLYQLPPAREQDQTKLAAFLEALPPPIRAAVEFRHASWFVPATYRLLEKNGAALCVNDNDDMVSPFEVTASHTYVRLRRSVYTPAERDAWCERLARVERQGIGVLAFIRHKDNPRAPLIALEFANALVTPKLA